MTLLLFDLDGTLLWTSGAGMRAMTRAGKEVLGPGFSFDGIPVAGGLDPLLFGEAARRCGVDDPSRFEAQFKRLYVQALREELQAGAAGVWAFPGVLDLLNALAGLDDVTLGILTGNFREGAWLKLEAAGIDRGFFSLSVCGGDAGDRRAMVALALQRYRARTSAPPDPVLVVVIGDTPRDIDCAHANGAPCLAVATGNYSEQELEAAGADAVAPDLTDPAPLFTLIKIPKTNPEDR
jgi:phosphoglycolate phosphatase-like HAD superfamily hydrolase